MGVSFPDDGFYSRHHICDSPQIHSIYDLTDESSRN